VLQSARNPNLWKLTDFGISVAASGHVMATRYNRGSDEYTPPEILHARPGIPTYGTSADVWGLGLILYELFTGHRVYNNRSEAFQLPPRVPRVYFLKHVTFPNNLRQTEIASCLNATHVVSTLPPGLLDKIARDQLSDFMVAVESMPLTKIAFLGQGNPTIQSRLGEINSLLEAMTQCDPGNRATINVLQHHFLANYVRNRLEHDSV
jgi:serine/threonine protein kinase